MSLEIDPAVLRRFGSEVRSARKGFGMTLAVLANEMGTTKKHICQIENAKGGAGFMLTLRLIDYLGLDVSEVVGG